MWASPRRISGRSYHQGDATAGQRVSFAQADVLGLAIRLGIVYGVPGDEAQPTVATMRFRPALLLPLLLPACGAEDATPPSSPALEIVSVEPAPHARSAEAGSPVVVRFGRPVRPDSVGPRSLWAFGRWSGAAPADYRFSDGNRTVTMVPRRPFAAGETVTVYVSHDATADDATRLRPAGFSWQFWTRAGRSRLAFENAASFSTRTRPSEPTRAYGGVASDLNVDGFLDLTLVNEDTADLRVFLNRGDGTGLFHDFLRPPAPVGRRASPSESSDFDRDGRVDLAVANIDVDTVSILLGNGDGSFGPTRNVGVGRTPRGLAVLDGDGDGDVDVVTANTGSGTLSLLVNDGQGRFSPFSTLDAGSEGEWAVASADMNADGILDLVVGAQGSQQVVVMAGNGDGSFRRVSSEGSGGRVWMLATGDVDGNGTEDVTVANSQSGNVAVLLGDGRGSLRRSQTLPVGLFPLASDLGDLDGDGDLDWVVSSNRGGWQVLRNEGGGGFILERLIGAPAAASCALLFDSDGDGDLDIALVDEDADQVILLRNLGP